MNEIISYKKKTEEEEEDRDVENGEEKKKICVTNFTLLLQLMTIFIIYCIHIIAVKFEYIYLQK